MQTFTVSRIIIIGILKPLSEKTRRALLGKIVYGIIKPLWSQLLKFNEFNFITTIDGVFIKFRPFVMHDFLFVMANKDHEPYVQTVFQPKQGDVVVDVGAHIGFYTLKSAKSVGSSGKVVAIEPDPQNFILLKNNIALNNFNNVIAVNAALSDFVGQKIFYCSTDPSLSGFQPSGSQTIVREAIAVNTLTLIELLKDLGIDTVNWLKIDVEGEELKVLKGSMPFLQSSNLVKIILEISLDKENILNYLSESGFSIKHLGDIYYFAFKLSSL